MESIDDLLGDAKMELSMARGYRDVIKFGPNIDSSLTSVECSLTHIINCMKKLLLIQESNGNLKRVA